LPPCGVVFFEGQRDSQCVFVMCSIMSRFLVQGYETVIFSNRDYMNNLFTSCAGADRVYEAYANEIIDSMLTRQRQKSADFAALMDAVLWHALPRSVALLVARFAQPPSLVVVHAVSDNDDKEWQNASFIELVANAKPLGVLHLFRHCWGLYRKLQTRRPDVVFFGQMGTYFPTSAILGAIHRRSGTLLPLAEFAALLTQVTKINKDRPRTYLVCQTQDHGLHQWKQGLCP
jgi:hypothetical protein